MSTQFTTITKSKLRRSINRREKLIMSFVNSDIKPRFGTLWGQKVWIEPAYVWEIEGDGNQVVYLKTGDCRPSYYVLRIDSNHDLDSDTFDPELLLTKIEDTYGNVDSENDEDADFPMLSTGNGYWWGSMKTFPKAALSKAEGK